MSQGHRQSGDGSSPAGPFNFSQRVHTNEDQDMPDAPNPTQQPPQPGDVDPSQIDYSQIDFSGVNFDDLPDLDGFPGAPYPPQSPSNMLDSILGNNSSGSGDGTIVNNNNNSNNNNTTPSAPTFPPATGIPPIGDAISPNMLDPLLRYNSSGFDDGSITVNNNNNTNNNNVAPSAPTFSPATGIPSIGDTISPNMLDPLLRYNSSGSGDGSITVNNNNNNVAPSAPIFPPATEIPPIGNNFPNMLDPSLRNNSSGFGDGFNTVNNNNNNNNVAPSAPTSVIPPVGNEFSSVAPNPSLGNNSSAFGNTIIVNTNNNNNATTNNFANLQTPNATGSNPTPPQNPDAADPPRATIPRQFGTVEQYKKYGIPFPANRKLRCNTCSSAGTKSTNFTTCNVLIDPSNGVQMGCTVCTMWGLVCCVEDIALPPRPTIPPGKLSFRTCQACWDNKTKCDKTFPCSACFYDRNDTGSCVRRTGTYGCVDRDFAVGTELYPYVSMFGGGPRGINDPHSYDRVYTLPRDFHIQVVHWLKGGPLPLPPGYDIDPNQAPPRPQINLRVLPFELPTPLHAVQWRTLFQMQRQAEKIMEERAESTHRAILIPPDDEFGVGDLLPKVCTMLYKVSQDLRDNLPLSPGPATTVFELDLDVDLAAPAQLPPDHPEYANLSLVSNIPPQHPNPTGTPAIRSIPYSFQNSISGHGFACEEQLAAQTGWCKKPARMCCEDLSHVQPLPVCDQHNNHTAAIVDQLIKLISLSLRAYACSGCATTAATSFNVYDQKRIKVYGLPPHSLQNASLNMPEVLPTTGCTCRDKIIGRTLCTGHRLEHFLDIRFRAQAMYDYVVERRGRFLCPFCEARVGDDEYNFTDVNGVPSNNVAYTCMSCLGVVVLSGKVHARDYQVQVQNGFDVNAYIQTELRKLFI
ncbi:hypothetical protein F5Y10DRAFT_283961 [Nemania abortiva]|nr:hypothetical protein F5Y10DRAFT_283961 [Nemania abortiva]